MHFPKSFYVANTLEIFERLAWYGFFTVSSLYMTSPLAQGGMGFSEAERGLLQGLIPFLLYLFPVVTGALADHYGYKKLFWLSFIIMCPAYYLLGQAQGFWSFFAAFLAVAIGAACFKPVVVGTVGRCTNDSNRGLGFGIFYTMVNLGGFLGPLVAGYVRAISWDWVFVMSACWMGVNMVILGLFYQDPSHDSGNTVARRCFKDVMQDTQEVLGNGRLALLIAPLIIALMIMVKGAMSGQLFLAMVFTWLLINWLWSGALKILYPHKNTAIWYRQPIKIGNKNFVVYLLILAGFWTVYNQLFFTLPLYIRDFVDTGDLVRSLQRISPGITEFLAHVNHDQLTETIQLLISAQPASAFDAHNVLVNYKVMVPPEGINAGLAAVRQGDLTADTLAVQWAAQYRQINPEYIINLDFGAIIFFQIAISYWLTRFRAIPILVVGTGILSLACLIGGMAHAVVLGGFLITGGVLVFAFGEMIASPKSQEYVAAIAPPNKTAMYMGYYFVSMALGMLFGGLLSGWTYGLMAIQWQKPAIMWSVFAAIGGLTALALFLLDRKLNQHEDENLAVALPQSP